MASRKKRAAKISEDSEEEQSRRQRLQAILLADSFATKLLPLTLERPNVLLPLVNVPMIDYTLAWLESAGIEEVFVFCSMQVIDYLNNSDWYSHKDFTVKTIESPQNSTSAGDALRYIYEQQIETSQIQGDFVLVNGCIVSNMPLTQLIQEHRDRKKKDEKAIMTMVIRQSLITDHQLFIAVNPLTKQLLYYDEDNICFDKSLLDRNPSVLLCSDMQDCYIDICSLEVLSLFVDNFDYQHMRCDFVEGVLADDIIGYKIFTHEISSCYASRIENFRSYDMVSKDIIQRRTFPYVPDMKFSGNRTLKLERQGIYKASDATQLPSAHVGASYVIGHATNIGSGTKILNSVIGNGCSIGSNVVIQGSYIWNNVTVEDGCEIRNAIVCDEVKVCAGAIVKPGVVLSFKVVVGRDFVVPAYSQVSLLRQPMEEDSDEENLLSGVDLQMESKLGLDGAGYIWRQACEDEWKHSVPPIPKDKLAEIIKAIDDDDTDDESVVTTSGDANTSINNDLFDFEREVDGTFLRAVEENIVADLAVLEINSLRLSYNMESAHCAGAIFYSMMKLAVSTPHSSINDLYRNASSIITRWKGLLGFYVKKSDEQIEVISRLEEMCEESAHELGTLFAHILRYMYEEENDLLQEVAILRWSDEKAGADESDKVYLKQCEPFITWLKETSDDEDG
ncbi:W2 domain [Arabidopsis thaliana x Arabidopsis arenosa]|uniref:Translation initiation factor eIF2B subunit epsilon n=3 Tax=Arabidopsis TaxID=3701 RepID=A0A178VF33_ARATH|nr:W2 domain [Arabidopsis thaliana x Arabidopsis arenosa]KAG7629736.1 W2 domain [Arabidopsis suecica]OAP04960.1 hypothetical protein AXX17_AT3G01480 [Arabidopsis thaliana]CAA0381076.1 unnamed protein product [Arabidopsis thaliana]CAD5321837.1 unnamed protein product [Arabidopsis thaliana]